MGGIASQKLPSPTGSAWGAHPAGQGVAWRAEIDPVSCGDRATPTPGKIGELSGLPLCVAVCRLPPDETRSFLPSSAHRFVVAYEFLAVLPDG